MDCLPNSSDRFRTVTYPLPVVPVHIDVACAADGARRLLSYIRPEWNPDDIKFTPYTGGYSNILIGCSLRSTSSRSDDIVLVRIYGVGLELMVDHEQECKSMVVLHSIGCAAPIYCQFDNGFAYSYLPGIVLDLDMARQPHIQRYIAREMVRMHSVDMATVAAKFGTQLHIDTQPFLFRSLYKWLELFPDSFDDPQKQASLDQLGATKHQLKVELDCLHEILPTLGSPIVFCHNDLLLKNIIYDEEQQKVSFIDFEYAGYNYEAFEIAVHFCEYADMDVLDFSLYPSRSYQLNWLRSFLEYRFEQEGRRASEVTSIDTERLYAQVNKFALAAHIFCVLWALVQAQFSTIDYDYVMFARVRLEQYRARKEEFLALEMP